jgi:competence protein ComEA
MPFSEEFKRFFKFNFSERRGLFFLCTLLILFVLLSRLSNASFSIGNKTNTELALFSLDSNNFVGEELEDTDHFDLHKKPVFSKSPIIEKVNKKSFDPNTASMSDLRDIGFYQQIAERIIKYRQKGGQFKTKADLKKVFGVSEKFYANIANQITIEKKQVEDNHDKPDFHLNPISFKSDIASKYEDIAYLKNIDINRVNFKTLMKIIKDSTISSKILKYKFALGGFHHVDQLKEIPIIQDSAFKVIQPFFIVQEENIFKKINLNLAEETELKYHPYIKNKLAKLIVAYRQNHPFTAVDELKKMPLVDLALFEKLKPYIYVTSIE